MRNIFFITSFTIVFHLEKFPVLLWVVSLLAFPIVSLSWNSHLVRKLRSQMSAEKVFRKFYIRLFYHRLHFESFLLLRHTEQYVYQRAATHFLYSRSCYFGSTLRIAEMALTFIHKRSPSAASHMQDCAYAAQLLWTYYCWNKFRLINKYSWKVWNLLPVLLLFYT